MAPFAQPVFHLRDARQKKAVPVEDLATLGCQDAADQPLGTFLADELRLDSAVQRTNHHFDRRAILVLPKQPRVHEGGVRHVQRIFGHGVERPRHFEVLANREVSGLIRTRDLVRPEPRIDVRLRIDPHPSLRIAACKRGNSAGRVIRLAAQARNRLARAGAVELPTVVVALDIPVDHAPRRKRSVSMGAPIEQRNALSGRVAKCNQG